MLSADILADVVSGVPVRLSPKTTTTHKLINTWFFSIEVLIKIVRVLYYLSGCWKLGL